VLKPSAIVNFVRACRAYGVGDAVRYAGAKLRSRHGLQGLVVRPAAETVDLPEAVSMEPAQPAFERDGRKLRILYVIHQFFPEFTSGTEKFLLNLASSVRRSGDSADVVTYTFVRHSDSRAAEGFTVARYVHEGIPVTAVRHQGSAFELDSRADDPAVSRLAHQMLGGGAYDLVHIVHPMRLGAFALAAVELRVPYLLTLTDFWTMCPKGFLQTSANSLCLGPQGGEECRRLCPELPAKLISARLQVADRVLRGAEAVVSPSRFLAAVFQREFPGLALRVVPHGMELPQVQPRSRTRGPDDPMVFGFAGVLGPHKGVHVLIKAFRRVQAPKAELRIHGGYFHQKEYFRYLQRLAEGDGRIRFCGEYAAGQFAQVLGELDVFVMPSLSYENYPLALHEALACRVPVVASNVGGMAEAVKDGLTGLTFRMGNEEDLRLKLQGIIDQPERLNAMRQHLAQRAPVTLDEEAAAYRRIYRAAVAR
jgi:glycosyltransferase involved in cell wall biosynthesis